MPFDCPSCNKQYSTHRGLSVHHTRVHDEKLPNRTCEHCGTKFRSDYQKTYCSEDCYQSAVSRAGENNPNYRGGKETTDCVICGASFEYYPSAKKGLYCSDCVETAQWRHIPELRGKKHPRWNGGKLDLQCETCNAPVKRYPSNVGEHGVFCSDKCRGDWIAETYVGEDHPHWKGGTIGSYGSSWTRVRRRALERDDYTCQHCGATAEELGRNPDVHHIVPVRAFVETPVTTVEDAHYLENLISLCGSCHRKAEFGAIDRTVLSSAIA